MEVSVASLYAAEVIVLILLLCLKLDRSDVQLGDTSEAEPPLSLNEGRKIKKINLILNLELIHQGAQPPSLLADRSLKPLLTGYPIRGREASLLL